MTRVARGFTLIELMVTLTVIVVLLAVALPSFQAARQRAAVRGAADQIAGFWNQARLDATKRDAWVKVGLYRTGGAYCLGAATAVTSTPATDTASCDCFTAGACDIARVGVDQTEWRGVTLSRSTFGNIDWPTLSAPGAAVIEPKLAALGDATQDGYIELTAPPGRRTYHLRVNVDQFGRATVCQPTSDADKLSDFGGRRC